MKTTTHKCSYCNSEFERNCKRPVIGAVYCSRVCGSKARFNSILINCLACGKRITRKPSQLERNSSNFCSEKCYRSSRVKLINISCPVCKTEFTRPPCAVKTKHGLNFCSDKCKKLAQKRQVMLNCSTCDVLFSRGNHRASLANIHYCSTACRIVGRNKQVSVSCGFCHKTINKSPSQVKPHNYCSISCAKSHKSHLTWVHAANGKQSVLYLVRIYDELESFCKIGVTFQTIQKRFGSSKSLCGYKYEVLASATSSPARLWDWEKSILETFAGMRYNPARTFAGRTECFAIEAANQILSIFPL